MLSLSIITGLIPMFAWGIADFLQSIALKKLTTAQVMFVSNLFFVLLILPFAFFVDLHIQLNSLIVVLISSLFMSAGMILFFESMKIGEVSIVSPISASYPIVTVLLLIILLGYKLSIITLIAILIMMLGIALASTDLKKIRHLHTVKGVREAVLALLFFGIYFFLLELLSSDVKFIFYFTAMDPYTLFFYTSLFNGLVLVCYGFLKKGKLDIKHAKSVVVYMFSAEVMYIIAWLALTYGFTFGDSAIITVVSSLFPSITILLALIFFKEKLVKNQYLGILLILLGLFLVSM